MAAPTPTPTPTGVSDDARLRRISVSFAVLSGVDFQCKALFVGVRNQGDHGGETIGVYVDIAPPVAACLPNGRIIETRVTSVSSDNINVFAVDGNLNGALGNTTLALDEFLSFSCSAAGHVAAAGSRYKITAVVDLHGDDLLSCGAGALGTSACFNALKDDDPNFSNNRIIKSIPRVQPP